jgi:hypothetical protein
MRLCSSTHEVRSWALTHWFAADRQDFVNLFQNDSLWSLKQYERNSCNHFCCAQVEFVEQSKLNT